MRFFAVLNKDGGTFRTIDIDAFSQRTAEVLEAAGHTIEFRVVAGKHLVDALTEASQKNSVDVILAGGGDGTVSAAAGILMNSEKILAVLPAGTMNLFARSLQVPQQIDAAVESFAAGETRSVDMATANDKPFVHQFSIGLHAKMVDLRNKMEYKSRFGKMGASMKAAYQTLKNPPSLKVRLKLGDAEIEARTSGISVSNNLFGEGHLPYADVPDGGTLGIYVTVARKRSEMLRHAINMLRGRWRDSGQVEIHEADAVDITLLSKHRKFASVIDGELYKLDRVTRLRLLPKSLKVLVPAAASKVDAA